jgi:hypothetical protein
MASENCATVEGLSLRAELEATLRDLHHRWRAAHPQEPRKEHGEQADEAPGSQ